VSANLQHPDSNETTPYSSLDTDDLKQLMDYAFYEEMASPDTLSELLKEYKKRKGIKTADSAEAWGDFQRYYSGHDETFPIDFENADNSKQTLNITEIRKTRKLINIKRLGIVGAVVAVISTLFYSTTAYRR